MTSGSLARHATAALHEMVVAIVAARGEGEPVRVA
jgi:hypothetical protein